MEYGWVQAIQLDRPQGLVAALNYRLSRFPGHSCDRHLAHLPQQIVKFAHVQYVKQKLRQANFYAE